MLKKHKYHVSTDKSKRVADGILFDSIKEKRRYIDLKLLEKAGEISRLERQRSFTIIPSVYFSKNDLRYSFDKDDKSYVCVRRSERYVADFVYWENGKLVIEDCKGFKTKEYKRKKKSMKQVFNITILET